MLRMAFESWIVHLCNCSMILEEASDLHSVLIVLPYTERQGLHSTVQEKCCVRVKATAQVIEMMSNPLDQSIFPDHGSGDDVRMAIQVFCSAVEGQVKAVLGRPIVHGASESVIDS